MKQNQLDDACDRLPVKGKQPTLQTKLFAKCSAMRTLLFPLLLLSTLKFDSPNFASASGLRAPPPQNQRAQHTGSSNRGSEGDGQLMITNIFQEKWHSLMNSNEGGSIRTLDGDEANNYYGNDDDDFTYVDYLDDDADDGNNNDTVKDYQDEAVKELLFMFQVSPSQWTASEW
eukprot:CAMPEP_0195536732 /NCGR_PEP_ID=MMETSP0794_2-20130614/46627_1 /TAXON_ID=515487 /ORGANISM="Stephanopyxis turris, Strain CCMP 815" /LENGTH=172 /DNA_ID=CAMNT_0040670231 /DNA_START=149 /DNA_END=664 /DNA_ORIENTATION=+